MPKKILVVDDSSSIRAMVEFTLKTAGYSCTLATDGLAGFQKAKQETFDLVLTDQNMPGMTGLEMVKELRKIPAYQSKPILILTTESNDAIKTQGRQAGATGWLTKPFDPPKLTAVVKQLVGQ